MNAVNALTLKGVRRVETFDGRVTLAPPVLDLLTVGRFSGPELRAPHALAAAEVEDVIARWAESKIDTRGRSPKLPSKIFNFRPEFVQEKYDDALRAEDYEGLLHAVRERMATPQTPPAEDATTPTQQPIIPAAQNNTKLLGRRPVQDAATAWCVSLKRAMARAEQPLLLDEAVKLALEHSKLPRLPYSTLRKRCHRVCGVPWKQVGTPEDPGRHEPSPPEILELSKTVIAARTIATLST